jgi:hypothetical protein
MTTGCTADPKEPGIATAASPGQGLTTSATPDPGVVAAYIEAVRRYVACMDEDGITFTDPDTRGNIELVGDLRLLKQDPAFLEASERCSPLLPPKPKELIDPLPPLTAEEIENARRYAECMRTNGAPDFPDPGPEGYFDERSPEWDQDSESAVRAYRLCAPIVGGSGDPEVGQG